MVRKPTSTLNADRVDLSAIASAHPVNARTVILDLDTFDASKLTLLEVLDMADAAGTDPANFGEVLEAPDVSPIRARLLYALAWIICRREDARVTFAEVCTWRMEVKGSASEAAPARAARRSKVVVGAAALAGVSPREAESMTVAELTEYGRRNRAARRR